MDDDNVFPADDMFNAFVKSAPFSITSHECSIRRLQALMADVHRVGRTARLSLKSGYLNAWLVALEEIYSFFISPCLESKNEEEKWDKRIIEINQLLGHYKPIVVMGTLSEQERITNHEVIAKSVLMLRQLQIDIVKFLKGKTLLFEVKDKTELDL